MSRYKNIVFDVGSVLVNWMRMNLYTTLFHGDREKAKWIINHVVTNEWNDQTDLGKPIDCLLYKYPSPRDRSLARMTSNGG